MQANAKAGLYNLTAPKGARKKAKRVGRGESSGHGKTCGRGHKGQKSRKSGNVRPGFEGGQNPLSRRLPKRGFNNSKFATDVRAINLSMLSERFGADAVVDQGALLAAGLVSKNQKIKILGNGDISHALTFRVHAMSKVAAEKVKEKGGTVELIG